MKRRSAWLSTCLNDTPRRRNGGDPPSRLARRQSCERFARTLWRGHPVRGRSIVHDLDGYDGEILCGTRDFISQQVGELVTSRIRITEEFPRNLTKGRSRPPFWVPALIRHEVVASDPTGTLIASVRPLFEDRLHSKCRFSLHWLDRLICGGFFGRTYLRAELSMRSFALAQALPTSILGAFFLLAVRSRIGSCDLSLFVMCSILRLSPLCVPPSNGALGYSGKSQSPFVKHNNDVLVLRTH